MVSEAVKQQQVAVKSIHSHLNTVFTVTGFSGSSSESQLQSDVTQSHKHTHSFMKSYLQLTQLPCQSPAELLDSTRQQAAL